MPKKQTTFRMEARRAAVVELHCAAHKPREISCLLNYPKSTVYDVIKRFTATGTHKRKVESPRKDKI